MSRSIHACNRCGQPDSCHGDMDICGECSRKEHAMTDHYYLLTYQDGTDRLNSVALKNHDPVEWVLGYTTVYHQRFPDGLDRPILVNVIQISEEQYALAKTQQEEHANRVTRLHKELCK